MTIDVVFKAIDKALKPIQEITKGVNRSIEAFDRMGQAVDEITTPYREFEQTMAELSSITLQEWEDRVIITNRASEAKIALPNSLGRPSTPKFFM